MRQVQVMIGMLVWFLAAASAVSAQEESATNATLFDRFGLSASGDLAFNSIYIWRGIMLDGDSVAQPGFYVTGALSEAATVKVGYWASFDMENRDALHSLESDLSTDFTYTVENTALSIGHIYYDFPDAAPLDGAPKGFSREVYVGVACSRLPLSPSVFYYYDYGDKADGGGEGSYTVLNLAKSLPFSVDGIGMSLDFAGHVGHNNKQYYAGKGGDAAIGMGVTIPLTGKLSCKPNINYSIPWGSVSDKGAGNQESRFYSGIYLNYSF